MSNEYIDTSPAAFPLYWPAGWKRTPARSRRTARFGDRGMYTACVAVREELGRFGASQVIVSTSVPLRRDGIPLAKPPVDGDPGASVYYTRSGKQECVAADIYDDVIDNVWAIAKVIESMRTIARHGSPEILERAFLGFAALPASTRRAWAEVLEVSESATVEEIERAFKSIIKRAHPDNGGNAEWFHEVTTARQDALQERRALATA